MTLFNMIRKQYKKKDDIMVKLDIIQDIIQSNKRVEPQRFKQLLNELFNAVAMYQTAQFSGNIAEELRDKHITLKQEQYAGHFGINNIYYSFKKNNDQWQPVV